MASDTLRYRVGSKRGWRRRLYKHSLAMRPCKSQWIDTAICSRVRITTRQWIKSPRGSGTPVAHDTQQVQLGQRVRSPYNHPHNLKVVGSNPIPATKKNPVDQSLTARSPGF